MANSISTYSSTPGRYKASSNPQSLVLIGIVYANTVRLWPWRLKSLTFSLEKKSPMPIWTNREVVETAENWSRKLFQFQNRVTSSSGERQRGTGGFFSTLDMLWKTFFVNWKADIHRCQLSKLGVKKNCLVSLTDLSLKGLCSPDKRSRIFAKQTRVFINPMDSWRCPSSHWSS